MESRAMSKTFIFICFISIFCLKISAQTVELYEQFNGRFDYTAIGNTLNTNENGPLSVCEILTSSEATLNLLDEQTIVAAYLYWAGSGSGDFEVELNGIPISAERTFNDALDANRVFFAAFADVTDIVLEQGSTNYRLSELDLTGVITPYCPTGTNFGGWAIAVIFEDNSLPLNQLNVYDGLESVPETLSITLDNLNVLDNENAKIGFIAWEGDSSLAVTEELAINGTVLSNPPLNPETNAFNGTNSFTGSSNLYNMDLDVYDIQNNISIGDTNATISLTSGQDFVMINSIITVLNSQLPDATISLNDTQVNCGDFTIDVRYTVSNFNSTDVLPPNVPIAFYIGNDLVAKTTTSSEIPIDGSLENTITISLSESQSTPFTLRAVVDDDGTGNGIITEINENNNSSELVVELLLIPDTETLNPITECNIGFEKASFNLLDAAIEQLQASEDLLSFYESVEDANNNINQISDPSAYTNTTSPQVVFIRLETSPCYLLYQFELNIENCPPEIPEGFSPNNDTINDWFNIKGLYNIFTDHTLKIFDRNGSLIFEGNNSKRWDGKINRGGKANGNIVPVGTYFYILNLNDSSYQPISGNLYVNY